LAALRPDQVLKILELTDSLNLHREAVFIPLSTEEHGSVTVLPDGRLRIICPNAGSFDEWLTELRGRLEKMDPSRISH
jgi:hypothetical protein